MVALLLAVLAPLTAQTLLAQETRELVTEADVRALRTTNPQYFNALGANSLSQADSNLIRNTVKVQVLQMTMASNQLLLPDIREKLKRENDLRAKQPARDVLMPTVVENCKLLLSYPLPIKLNALMLITELNETPADTVKGIPAVPYQGMVEPLLAVLADAEQHEALKVVAVNGLLRVCRDSTPKVDVRMRIAEALVKTLENPQASDWLKMLSIQAVARTDVLLDTQRRPFIIQKLTEILVDPKQGWRVRADAAYALGRVSMNESVNVPLITHEIAKFAHEMAVRYNASKDDPHWRYCASRLYLAFRPEDARDTAFMDRSGKAPLSRFRPDVQGAYDRVLPIVNGILGSYPGELLPKAGIDQLKTWIDGNVPKNMSVSLDPNVKLKPIRAAG